MTWLFKAFGLSLVTKMGGFGLFLDPGGLPLGLRLPTSTAPSPGSSLLSSSSSSSSRFSLIVRFVLWCLFKPLGEWVPGSTPDNPP